MPRTSDVDWPKLLEQWKDSGLTAKDFAAQAGVNASTLATQKWKAGLTERRLRKHGDAVRSNGASKRAPRTKAIAAVASTPPLFELVLHGGVVVRVPPDFDEEALKRLVRAAEASR